VVVSSFVYYKVMERLYAPVIAEAVSAVTAALKEAGFGVLANKRMKRLGRIYKRCRRM